MVNNGNYYSGNLRWVSMVEMLQGVRIGNSSIFNSMIETWVREIIPVELHQEMDDRGIQVDCRIPLRTMRIVMLEIGVLDNQLPVCYKIL